MIPKMRISNYTYRPEFSYIFVIVLFLESPKRSGARRADIVYQIWLRVNQLGTATKEWGVKIN